MTDIPPEEVPEPKPTVRHTLTILLPDESPIELEEGQARQVFHLLGDALRESHGQSPEVR
jgi:hypothetical protein